MNQRKRRWRQPECEIPAETLKGLLGESECKRDDRRAG
ncbi:hypothetical protein AMIS_20140 [Actinoplanes missouriensis 431]|uniref:Uncharacterized protein n=1 Tax=Actinoplanes missouriensis (strain ATCC 14538 / DSM 43046 / CBS 188.64 / JCM 3121 / NBRC 102363 / NCIMB 12654 / NRRL B-3342 / UNCC 431) TaxID=512565 RepID=I0H2J7_ACTM4|nr:hypothetical protein AMIS_20140 [Actinoplanes missouriensis 431]